MTDTGELQAPLEASFEKSGAQEVAAQTLLRPSM
jgi:hypothetical protein